MKFPAVALSGKAALLIDWNRTSHSSVQSLGVSPAESQLVQQLVLVVEDDDFIRMDAVDIFQEAGYRVLEAACADKALEHLQQRDDIVLIFTDIEMPGSMDGLALAAMVRDRWPPIGILIASGRARPLAAQLPPFARFLPKPYTPSQISHAVERVLADQRH